jgi:hypothetical protein
MVAENLLTGGLCAMKKYLLQTAGLDPISGCSAKGPAPLRHTEGNVMFGGWYHVRGTWELLRLVVMLRRWGVAFSDRRRLQIVKVFSSLPVHQLPAFPVQHSQQEPRATWKRLTEGGNHWEQLLVEPWS